MKLVRCNLFIGLVHGVEPSNFCRYIIVVTIIGIIIVIVVVTDLR